VHINVDFIPFRMYEKQIGREMKSNTKTQKFHAFLKSRLEIVDCKNMNEEVE